MLDDVDKPNQNLESLSSISTRALLQTNASEKEKQDVVQDSQQQIRYQDEYSDQQTEDIQQDQHKADL